MRNLLLSAKTLKNKAVLALTSKHEGISEVIVSVGLILVAIVLVALFKDSIYEGIKGLLGGVSNELGDISNWSK